MFRPSQALLFRSMPILSKLSIHQQLPLNPSESRQLLILLTRSFRRQLDAEHPPLADLSGSGELQNATLLPKSTPRRHVSPTSALSLADSHMESLLTNPLFDPKINRNALEPSQDPMVIFERAVALGTMNIGWARLLLTKQMLQVTLSSAPTIAAGIRESGAGLKVVKWLKASGTVNDPLFLQSQDGFADVLMEFMVAEGLQETALAWIRKAPQHLHSLNPSVQQAAAFTKAKIQAGRSLRALIRAEAHGKASLETPYLLFARTARDLKGLSPGVFTPAVRNAGLWLAYETIHRKDYPVPSKEAFESFLELIPSFNDKPKYLLAHLSLFHPTDPNPDLALAFLDQIPAYSTIEGTAQEKTRKVKRSNMHITLALETAGLLWKTKRESEATWVLNFLQKNYPKELGLDTRTLAEQQAEAKAEAASLELLEALSLA